MKSLKAIVAGSVLLITVLFTQRVAAQHAPTGGIHWLSLEEALEKCKTEPRKLLIDCYTDWCGWCKRMDATTFSDSIIGEQVNKYFYAVKLNAEQKEDILFKEKVYHFVPNGSRGYNEFAATILQGQLSYPTIVYMDENQNVIQAIPGYQQTNQLDPILIFFGSDYYKTNTWEMFLKEYKSPFGG